MSEVIYIACPLCGMNRVLTKTGASAIARGYTISDIKGRIRFDHMDLSLAPIVQVRERRPGKETVTRMRRGGGSGFVFKEGLTLEAMKNDPGYQDLVEQMKSTAQAILAVLS